MKNSEDVPAFSRLFLDASNICVQYVPVSIFNMKTSCLCCISVCQARVTFVAKFHYTLDLSDFRI